MRLHDYLDYYAREAGDVELAICAGRTLSYRQACIEANRIANAFIASGLQPGDRIALLAKNCLEYPLLYLAASKAGVVPVPLNYRLAPPEWSYIVSDAGAKLVVAQGELARALDAVRSELKSVERFVALGAPLPAGWESFLEWSAAAHGTPPAREIDLEADVYQMYTSGTTGRPKGAIITHRSLSANIAQLQPGFDIGRGERYLIVAPLYHAAASIAAFLSISNGATLYIHEEFVPAEVVRALSEERIAHTTLVPAMIQACLVGVPGVAERRYESLRQIAYGASPISEETLRRAMQVFGCDFTQGYGMTETTAVLTLLGAVEHRRALLDRPELLLSCGRPILGTEIRIVDEQDRPLPPGAIGQIVARGPQLMRGYWNLHEATRETLAGGWMHTGDAGTLDAEGYVYIQDRVKDMIVSGGENVYPREVENALFEHPAVIDVAVIGIPDARWGEAVKAIVVLREGASASPAELIDYCRGKLAGYKLPRSIDFVASLPRNPTGKVLKTALREPYWSGRERRVS
jgi:acyl-CoA synthetase (AMP-forming)/AMP-acid ligase II